MKPGRLPANGLIWLSGLGALILVGASLFILWIAPTPIERQWLWSGLKDIGGFIAGSWILSAALLTLTATGLTLRAAAKDALGREARREEVLKQACVGEVLSFWDRVNFLKLHEKLEAHIRWLEKIKNEAKSTVTPNLFRRSLGDEWFLLSRLDRLAIGELQGGMAAEYFALSAQARHLVHRLTYLNNTNYSNHKIDFWIRYHNDTLEVLNGLYAPSKAMLEKLNRQEDPRTYLIAGSAAS